MSAMGSGVPLLNDYKQDFFWKRFPQTVLGGPKLRLGYDAPCFVYIGQIFLFFVPWIIGGIFTALVETGIMGFEIAVYVFGGIMCLFVLCGQIVSSVIHSIRSSKGQNKHTASLLAEEDEVDFTSCCGPETVSFIIPPKKYKFNIALHSVMSGVICGLGLWYLLPQTLNSLYYNNIGATVILFILGWLTLCISQYPLTTCAPPELSTYKTLDTFELSPLIRPFYIIICESFFLLNTYLSGFLLVDQILHIVFVTFPLIWILGVLPPLDALLFWGLEQLLVVFFGGTSASSDLWTIVMLLLSVGVFLAVYFIPLCLGSVVMAATLGYILSTDIGGLLRDMIKYYQTRNKVSSSQTLNIASDKHRDFPWARLFLTLVFHLFMTGMVIAMSLCLVLYRTSSSTNAWLVLGYVIIGVLVLEKLVRDFQGVFLCFGLWRNKLYPASAQSQRFFRNRKHFLNLLGYMRRFVVNFLAPLVMVAYLSLVTLTSDPSSLSCQLNLSTSDGVWLMLSVTRAYRWVWQSTVHSLLELSVVHIILVNLPTNTTVQDLGAFRLLLITSVCRDRLYQIANKLYFCFTLLVTSWTDKKQRRKSSIWIVLVNVLLFPVVLLVVVVAAILSAPLLPLFSLPVFLIGFPRPLRSWPSSVGASANTCADTVFYKQLSHNIAVAMKTAFASGSLGEPHPGNHYLLRFQDRMIWVLILERGYTYCTMSIKGLELQETSCHSVEATRVDDIFELSFEGENGFPLCSFNQYPLHTLTPCDAMNVKTYSDARNILTGIIDSPDNFKFVFAAFPKVLIWVLIKEVFEMNNQKQEEEKGRESSLTKLETKDTWGNNNNKEACPPQKDTVVTIGATSIARAEHPVVHELEDDDVWSDSRPTSAVSLGHKRKSSWGSSLRSFSSILSNDNNFIEMDEVKPSKKKSSQRNLRKSSDSVEELGFGMPAVDPKAKPKPPPLKPAFQVSGKAGNSIYRPVTNLAGSAEFMSPHSSRLSFPTKWRELPIEESRVKKLTQDFPTDWYRHVIESLQISSPDQSTLDITAELVKDEVLQDIYSQLTMSCCGVFDANVMTSHGGSTSHLYKCYRGDVPWNAMLDWLTEDKHLFGLVLQAYRYSFKLMLDQCVLGEISDDEELSEYLKDYHRNWYIGLDTDPEWNVAVMNNKSSLFSVGLASNQGTYSSRVVTLQDTVIHAGRLNAEAVRGQWANLSLELLYFTNDDEERYSIQAHPTLLRNLTVQSADPPLGYPIYSSEPISVCLL